LPKRRAEVPTWLAAAYGVPLINGEPQIAGLEDATARAKSILSNRRVLWREKIGSLRSAARDAPTPAESNRLRLDAARAEVAMREGRRFPHAEVVARSEFLITLDVHREQHGLPFVAVCFVAWWKGLLVGHPGDEDIRRDARDLLGRHW
jgi:hypothetical protein